ncbi:MAG: sensor histidine kinase, partial [Bryobacteraceae bacterium]
SILPIAGGLLAGAVIPALVVALFVPRVTAAWIWISFSRSLAFSICIGGLAWLTLPRWAPRFARRGFPWDWMWLIGALLLIACAGCLAAVAVLAVAGAVAWPAYWRTYFWSLRISILITLLIGSSSYLYETFKHRLEKTRRELAERQREVERERQAATEARLTSLESRVHPHFLFNTLNSITALIRDDPAAAERLVERLAALLRFSLDSHARLVPLQREMKVVVDYLEIERTRFGARLDYYIDIPPALADREVPPLAVQSLVENSVKYAIAPRREGGRISISARPTGAGWEIAVADDGPGFSAAAIVPGHGLDNLRLRLSALYGDRGGLRVEPGAVILSLV